MIGSTLTCVVKLAMRLTDEEIISKLKIKPGDRVLDVGGSMKQHLGINIDTIADAIRPEESEYNKGKLLAKNFVKLDFNRDMFPFRDNEFDVVLCTHTLEDLPYPFLAVSEMSRVGKRGYIATPSMGEDIVFSHFDLTNWGTGGRRVPGLSHHKWLFYIDKNTMRVLPKNYPLLYSGEFHFVKWLGEKEFRYFWNGKIKYEEVRDLNFKELIRQYRSFVRKNRKLLKKGSALFYLDNPYFYLKEIVKTLFK